MSLLILLKVQTISMYITPSIIGLGLLCFKFYWATMLVQGLGESKEKMNEEGEERAPYDQR